MTINRRDFAVAAALSSLAPVAARAAALPSAEAQADKILRDEMKLRRIPGLQAIVIRKGRVVFQRSLGVANLQYGTPVTADTIFSINSCTKAFTGLAIMQLVEAGQVDLDAPVSTYLADLPTAWRAIPIRMLLSHMSGLPNAIDNGSGDAIAPTEAATWTALQTLPILFPAGQRFHYCQTNYLLLGKIIDKLTGKPFTQVVQTRQLAVAGMSRTLYGDSRDIIPGAAQNYRLDYPVKLQPGQLQNNHHNFLPFLRTGAGLNSTAGDLARWMIALNGGKLLSKPANVQRMLTAQTFNDGTAGEWTLGWIRVARTAHPAVGATGGGRAAFYLYPEDDAAVIILTNLAGGSPEDFADQLVQPFVPGLTLNGVSALRVALQADNFRDVAGTYETLKRDRPDFEISEIDLNNWAYRLMRTERAFQAVDLFKLATRLFPTSGNVWDSLGDSYAWVGDKASAIQAYEKSLQLDPGNGNAVAQLKRLKAS